MRSAHNHRARALNASLFSPHDRLSPLINVNTNGGIPNFPETSADITEMRLRDLDSVLLGLAYPVLGALDDKRKFLRTLIGLQPDAPTADRV